MATRIKDTDKGYRALCKRVFGQTKAVISVGIHEDTGAEAKKPPNDEGLKAVAEKFPSAAGVLKKESKAKHQARGLTLIEVAEWNEFGLGVPERSFIRAWFDENAAKCREDMSKMLASFLRGDRTIDQVLNILGSRWKGQIQKRIADGIPPENAPVTIQRKGSSKPLIDTGQLRSGIQYRITDASKR